MTYGILIFDYRLVEAGSDSELGIETQTVGLTV
jgi:hypothetical protein